MGQTRNNTKRGLQTVGVAAVVVVLAAQALAQSEPRKVLVSIPDRKLALMEGNRVVKVYPVAVGKISTPSPAGKFRVVNRVVNPTYYQPGVVIPAGPDNPLGSRWIGLSRKSYGIHGTNAPKSIGKAVSHGCIRMAQRDLEELFELLRVGEKVEIRSQRDQETALVFANSEKVVVAQAQSMTVAGSH
jgi:lipoprotein-anchoring transpeptidase ErfK/SrfK